MHHTVFVRHVHGSTLSLDAEASSSVKAIKRAVAAKTAIAPADQRIVYAGKDLQDDISVEHYDLQPGATLDLLLRLPGGAKKKRCAAMLDATERCSQPSLSFIGSECKACSKQFCSTHRLPEDHTCEQLDSVKEQARSLNSSKLVADSIAAGPNLHNVAY